MVSNPNFYGQSTHGTPNQIEDGVDFPHTGIVKALSDGLGQNYAISGFDITIDSATQIDVGAGVIFRDGKKVAVSAVANLTLSSTYTNGYHLLIASSASSPVLTIRNPTAADKVAQYTPGDTIIAVITHNGTANVGVQYLTVNKTENSLSLGYNNSGYTETGTLTADADGITMTGLYKLDALPTATAHGTNSKVLIQDGGNSDEIRTITAQSIADLAPQGDITGVTAGDGLTGGGNSGAVTLAVGVDDSTIEINSDALRIKDSGVTLAKLADITDERILGRVDNGTATVAELTKSQVLTMLNVADGATVYTDAMAIAAVEGESTLELAGAVALNNKLEFSKIGTKDFNGDVIVDYSNASENTVNHQYTLGLASNYNGKVFVIKNMHTASMNIIPNPAGSDKFEDNRPSTDSRWVSATQLTLKPLQSVTLQATQDDITIPLSTPDTIAAGWLIIDDSQGGAGISNVVDDTTPQLGGNLDVNSNKITGSIVFDGDVNIEAGHTLRATTLPVVDINSPTTLVLDTHAGRYLLCSADVTLPSSSTQGDQYYILNDSGSSITIGNNGNNINGLGTSVTLTSYKGATCIAIGTNHWIVLGV